MREKEGETKWKNVHSVLVVQDTIKLFCRHQLYSMPMEFANKSLNWKDDNAMYRNIIKAKTHNNCKKELYFVRFCKWSCTSELNFELLSEV